MQTLNRLIDLVVDPVIRVLFAVATVYFMYGLFTYVRESKSSEGRLTGSRHIMWSLIGLFIMISVWGIILIIKNTLGVPDDVIILTPPQL